MQIRLARISDAPGLAKVQVNSYRTAYRGLLPQVYLDQFSYEAETQDWINLLSKDAPDPLYVADDDADRVLGYALGRSLTDGDFDCELRALHVRKSHQRQGIGTALVAAIATHFAEAGATSLTLWTMKANPSRAMYEKLGGVVVDEQTRVWDDGTSFTEVAYGWPDIRALIDATGQ